MMKFLVATECVGPLVVDSWDVVDLKLDTRNGGSAFYDLGEAAQLMMAAPAVTLSEPCHSEMRPESSSGERKRQTRSASCASNSKQPIRG